MADEIIDCGDCGALPGKPHADGCDVERCSVCGLQKLGCDCHGHDKQFARWTGLWPGLAEVQALGIDLNEFTRQRLFLVFFVKPPREMNGELGAENWLCICGNMPAEEGFTPCNSGGGEVEPSAEDWRGDTWVCERCGRIINSDRHVEGVRPDTTLNRAECMAVLGSIDQRIGLQAIG